jgi:hypothetical protein
MNPSFRFAVLASLGALAGCFWNAAGPTGCVPVGAPIPLPEVLGETSGVAFSRAAEGVLLTHNDGGHAAWVYALDTLGQVLGELQVAGAENQDWEDIATSECDEGACIYLADIGDNQLARDSIVLYRLPDPGTYEGQSVPATAYPMRLPDGPRDMETLFVLPGEEVFFVSKGRSHSVSLYRYPPPLRPGELVTLEWVQDLTDGPLPLPKQVTGADVARDGVGVAVRSYEGIRFYQWEDGRREYLADGQVALLALGEVQGEGVGLGPRGQVILTSEAALGQGATLRKLRCDLVSGTWRPTSTPPSFLSH